MMHISNSSVFRVKVVAFYIANDRRWFYNASVSASMVTILLDIT